MSEENSNLAEIQKHREQIDEIDREIVALLNKRAGHSLVIRGLKPGAHLGLYDARREEEIRLHTAPRRIWMPGQRPRITEPHAVTPDPTSTPNSRALSRRASVPQSFDQWRCNVIAA